jgi:glycosyltransferase involved in cell wall biosynthesis
MHVVDSLERGGLERVVTDLAIAQHLAGHTVLVFSLLRSEGFSDDLRRAGVAIEYADKRAGLDLRVLHRLRRACSARTLDVVHSHNFVPAYYAAASMLNLRQPPAFVGTCHDMGGRLANRRLRWLFGWALRRMAKVAMVGRQVHERYRSLGLVPEAKVRIVQNGIPLDRFGDFPRRREAARVRLGLAADAIVIGCVGRLVPLKNHQAMIEALPLLLERFPTVRLLLVGGGPLEAELRSLADRLGLHDCVVFVGECSDAAPLLCAFDVYAQPSTTEGLSIALLEACASGLPIVATRVGGNPDVIADGVTGCLIPVNDPPALHNALVRLLSAPELRESLGRAAAIWARTHASVDRLVASYDHIYQEASLCR